MPTIKPGNRLYLYQLFSREIGVGRQTLLPRYEEALAGDGLCATDLGCADMRELGEALPEFIKLTVFKKGYVYATVLANEEYDRALEQLGRGDAKAPGNKPWKRRRGAKALKPVKPRHVEQVANQETEAIVEATPVADEPEPETAPEPEPIPEPEPASKPEAAREPEPQSEPEPEPEPESEPEPKSEPEPTPSPESRHAPDSTPAISLTITYVPDQPAETPRPSTVAGRALPQGDLPQDFHRDVRCPSDQLSKLYQVLPPDVDPLATLEEDFRVARSTGTLEGTRSNVAFGLRYLQTDGASPVRVTLRHFARPVAGKRWAIIDVEVGEPAEVRLEGLSEAAHGAWSAFVRTGSALDPERLFAQTVIIGSWDDVLGELAGLAKPEDWGPNRRILRDYLTMTFVRIQAEGKLVASGNAASFDTGLLTRDGAPLRAQLAQAPDDIPWTLAGFSAHGDALPAHYVSALAEAMLDPSLPAPELACREALVRNPRLATPAYDPMANEVRLLVPADGKALALARTDSGYARVATLELEDAYVCARVVSSEQPSWLAPAANDRP